MIIVNQFKTKCAGCGKVINPGQKIGYQLNYKPVGECCFTDADFCSQKNILCKIQHSGFDNCAYCKLQ
jgi:hypothetical protein